MKVTVDVDDDEIVLAGLKDQYRSIWSSIEALKGYRELLHYQAEDLYDHKRNLKAFRKVIRYYTSKEEFDKFIKEFE